MSRISAANSAVQSWQGPGVKRARMRESMSVQASHSLLSMQGGRVCVTHPSCVSVMAPLVMRRSRAP
jgi:hypothetical protein